jgi:hypothetical protein
MVMDKPEFPITISFLEDSSAWILNSEDELANNLEWFDSRDDEEHASVIDARGRLVRLKVEKLEVIDFFLETEKK